MRFDLLFLYFVYGLAFFVMGVVLFFEATRAPNLAEARVLRPLGAFGLLHGLQEWLEFFLLQLELSQIQYPPSLQMFRLALLAGSFAFLLLYGLQMLVPEWSVLRMWGISSGVLFLYVVLLMVLIINPQPSPETWWRDADVLLRYLLAFPALLLATFALYRQARDALDADRLALARTLKWAGLGMGAYGSTQIFVVPASLFLSPWLNSDSFLRIVGIPVPWFRVLAVLVLLLALLRATQLVEQERRAAFTQLQTSRLAALEQVKTELLQRENLREQYLRHIVETQEDERARISRELHDQTAQSLTALSINLAALRNHLPASDTVDTLTKRLQVLCDDMATSIQGLVHELRPALLDDLGLIPALHYLTDHARQSYGIIVELEIHGARERLEPWIETVLYRIAQESLTNVARHAKTKTAQLALSFTQVEISLHVQDDGVGFMFDNLDIGFGIAGMRERAEAVGGTLDIQSEPQQGTIITIRIPRQERAT